MKNNVKRLALHIEPRVTPQDSFVLGHLLREVRSSGMVVAEVGSFLGNGSTQAIIKEVMNVNGALYCIDTWKGNRNVEWHTKLSMEYEFFDTFLYYIEESGGNNFVKPMFMESRDAAKIFKDQSCDLVFIDGDHSYEGVREDISMWAPKVKSGGILSGHDCEGAMQDFDKNVIDMNHHMDFIELEKFRFNGVHPGVVKAVDEAFNGRAKVWSHENLTAYGFHGHSTIWSMVINNDSHQ